MTVRGDNSQKPISDRAWRERLVRAVLLGWALLRRQTRRLWRIMAGTTASRVDRLLTALDVALASQPVTVPVTPMGTKVLVVEDNPINQKITAALLASQGHRFDLVENGAKAVDQVQNDLYGVVLMDIQMPVMDGMEATRRIRALPGPVARIPIVAVTANAMNEDRETYLDAGMDDFVPKPIDALTLICAVESHLLPSDQADSPVIPLRAATGL